MKSFLLSALMVGALSFTPALLNAQDHEHDQEHHQSDDRSYHDRTHHDEHQWNSNEDAAWGRYRGQHHIRENDFSRLNERQQQSYWNWRHQHGDEHDNH